MKIKMILLPVLFAFLFAGNIHAQLTASILKDGNEINNMQTDTSAHITSFTVRIVSDDTYLKWTVAGLQQDGIFAVYYSCDGINYSIIGSKTAVGVPIKKDIAYYFTCKVSRAVSNYYRIVYINNQYSEYLTSDKIYVCDEAAVCPRGFSDRSF